MFETHSNLCTCIRCLALVWGECRKTCGKCVTQQFIWCYVFVAKKRQNGGTQSGKYIFSAVAASSSSFSLWFLLLVAYAVVFIGLLHNNHRIRQRAMVITSSAVVTMMLPVDCESYDSIHSYLFLRWLNGLSSSFFFLSLAFSVFRIFLSSAWVVCVFM